MALSSVLTHITKLSAIVIFLSYLIYFSNDREYINYDAIPYVAAAYLIKNNNIDEAHNYTWSLLKRKTAPEIYDDLCCGNIYKKSMSSNKEAFFSHLPAYASKSGYVYLVRMVADLFDKDEYQAMKIISQLSIILVVLIASMLFYNRNTFIFLSIFPLFILSQVLALSRLLSPDALIALILLASTVLILKNKINLGLALMMCLIVLRQNNIIFFGLGTLLLLKERNFLNFTVWCAAGLSLYFYNSYQFESLGYWKSFHSTLIYLPSTFVNYDPPFSLSIYFNLLGEKFLWMLTDRELNRFIAIIIFNSIISLYFFTKLKPEEPKDIELAAIFSFGMIISYLMFPIPDQRLYTGAIIASSLMILNVITRNKLK